MRSLSFRVLILHPLSSPSSTHPSLTGRCREGGTQGGAVVDVSDGVGAARRSPGGGGDTDHGRPVRGGDGRGPAVEVRVVVRVTGGMEGGPRFLEV